MSRCSPPRRRRSSSACSTRRANGEPRASRCRSAPATSSTAHRRRHRRRRALRPARARPLRARTTGIASTRPSCCSIPTRWRSTGRFGCIRRCSAAARRPRPHDSRQRAVHAQGDRRGAERAARDASAGPLGRTVIYELHVRGFTQRHPGDPRGAARHLRGPRRIRRPSRI